MRQNFSAQNFLDADTGKPAGGYAYGTGIDIRWQNGPLGRDGERVVPNGAFVETVIAMVLERMYHYQDTEFRCRENALVITKLEEALHWMDHRTNDREKRQVEGTHAI